MLNKANDKHTAAIINVLLTPMLAIRKPPANGPNTEPSIHDVLLHVIACDMRSLATNNGKSENEEGAKNERIQPLKNIAAKINHSIVFTECE